MKGDPRQNKPQFDKNQSRSVTPPRVAARMEGKVKNVGTRPVRKPKQNKKRD